MPARFQVAVGGRNVLERIDAVHERREASAR
jgi:hypothetical protein